MVRVSGKKAMPLVAWNIVQLPKKLGGLSIGNIIHKNLAILYKWIWRFFQDPSSFWCQVVRTKYNYPPSISFSDLHIPSKGGPWKQICAAIFSNAEALSIASKGMRKIIGDGSSSLFWLDPWISNEPLKNLFPRLFSIAIDPKVSVASQGFWEGFNWVWSFAWRRAFRPQDHVEKAKLDEMLQHVYPSLKAHNKYIWTPSKSGNFTTKSFPMELDKLQPPPHHDAIKGVWKRLVPHRIEVFVWIALMGKINTRNKLASLEIIPPQNNIYPLCLYESESSDHLLLHCHLASQLWNWWMNLWNIKWVFSSTLREAFIQWQC